MLEIVLYSIGSTWTTQLIRDLQVGEEDLTVFIAAGRAISTLLGWKKLDDWRNLTYMFDIDSKALCRHITVHSWLTPERLYVPLPGIDLTHEEVELTDIAVLQEKFAKASEYNILEHGLQSKHLDVPPNIYSNAKFALISLQDYEPLVYFNEPQYCGSFIKPRETWSFYTVPQLPDDEALQRLEGIVVTGAKYAAYELEIPWMTPFLEFTARVVHQYPNIRMLGICLGCQTAAAALGGEAIKDPKIPFIYKYETIELTEAAKVELPELPDQLYNAEVHGDCVSQLPPGAQLYAYSDTCGVELWGIPGKLLASQFHPEFSKYFLEKYMDAQVLKKKLITPEEAEASLASHSRPNTSEEVLTAMTNWLHHSRTSN
mmetsp:Transcript_34264/g.59982  ORF Transcript_34264/g.59982 Transcript_34264/m.59982 type:complete len:373 (-) Transcript_34264:24-1142(-)